MPECIEVAWTADCLKKMIVNKEYENSQVLDVFTHGKQLFIQLSNGKYINIHFGLTGYLSTISNKNYLRHTFVFGNVRVYMYDKLNFGKWFILDQVGYLSKIESLGLDVMNPNEFTITNLTNIVSGKRVSISKFLLEQKYISGIGNYLKCEIIYHLKVSPKVKMNDLKQNQILQMYDIIRFILFNAYFKGFTNQTKKEYNDIARNFGMAEVPLTKCKKDYDMKNPVPYTFEVYEQDHNSLGNPVVKEMIDGRMTYYVNFI